jgi:hypothetical protein
VAKTPVAQTLAPLVRSMPLQQYIKALSPAAANLTPAATKALAIGSTGINFGISGT